MTKGANEVSFCASLSYAWSLQSLLEPVVEESFTPAQTDSKCLPTWPRAQTKCIQGVWHLVSSFASISYALSMRYLWDPSWRNVSHRLEQTWNACRHDHGCKQLQSGYLALSFVSCPDFVCMEHIVQIGIRRGGKFNTDSDGLKMHVDITYGANELHAGCWSLVSFCVSISLAWSLHELLESVMEGCFTPTRTDSKCIPTWLRALTKSTPGVWHAISVHPSILYARSL